jgi:thiamine-monophosphate kinase
MRIGEAGEFSLIKRIRRAVRRSGSAHRASILGIGDDAAILFPPPGREVATTTDALMEGVHFVRGKGTPADLGYRTLAASLSDMAAMGAEPAQAFLTLALPSDTELSEVDGFLRGFLAAAGKKVVLAGGDTVSSRAGWAVSVTVLGLVEKGRALRRARARPGEVICVSGPLGDSAAGLDLLLGHLQAPERERRALVRAHLHPPLEVALGRHLVSTRASSCAIDLSDGLLMDLGHVMEESGVGAHLELSRIPLSAALRRVARGAGRDPLSWALAGGEDYRLLFTLPAARAGELSNSAARKGFSITAIGTVIRAHRLDLTMAGKRVALPERLGYDHFAR